MAGSRIRCEDYSVGWVCALPIELAAAQEMLDQEHKDFIDDTNIYTLGRIGEHNVVIACLPEGQMGITSAAVVAVQMKSTFTSIRFGLIVGVGGGVPNEEADIRLGDVVVGVPHKQYSGVVQYDFGKATPSGFERSGALNSPPTILLNAVAKMRARYFRGRSRLLEFASKLNGLSTFTRQNAGPDILFEADYNHIGGATCDQCSKERAVKRQPRSLEVMVHYGTVASGNQVIRNAVERDRLSSELGGVLCFEMEAAGLINSFPCLVIRGVCDYADSHKNKRWQAYAAGTSAACAKEVLSMIPIAEVANSRTADDIITEQRHQNSNSALKGSSVIDITEQHRQHSHSATLKGHSVDDIITEQHRQYSNSATLKGPSRAVYPLLASGSRDTMVRVWDAVYSVAFSPDGKLLASGSVDDTVRVWDAVAGSALQTLKCRSLAVYSVAFSPDGKLLASGSFDGTVRVWDAVAGSALQTLKCRSLAVYSVAFSPDGKLLAMGSSDSTVTVWDAVAGSALQTLKGHSDGVYSVAFSPDGKLLASGSRDTTVRVWDAAAGSALQTLEGHSRAVRSVTFSPDGKLLASGSDDRTVRVGDAAAG